MAPALERLPAHRHRSHVELRPAQDPCLCRRPARQSLPPLLCPSRRARNLRRVRGNARSGEPRVLPGRCCSCTVHARHPPRRQPSRHLLAPKIPRCVVVDCALAGLGCHLGRACEACDLGEKVHRRARLGRTDRHSLCALCHPPQHSARKHRRRTKDISRDLPAALCPAAQPGRPARQPPLGHCAALLQLVCRPHAPRQVLQQAHQPDRIDRTSLPSVKHGRLVRAPVLVPLLALLLRLQALLRGKAGHQRIRRRKGKPSLCGKDRQVHHNRRPSPHEGHLLPQPDVFAHKRSLPLAARPHQTRSRAPRARRSHRAFPHQPRVHTSGPNRAQQHRCALPVHLRPQHLPFWRLAHGRGSPAHHPRYRRKRSHEDKAVPLCRAQHPVRRAHHRLLQHDHPGFRRHRRRPGRAFVRNRALRVGSADRRPRPAVL
eukprot:comp22504_c0_seq1/m.56183 comp22504_c0_seq1/g.56183  ORF comp22504_c0_seq1/g.56183 comp22504_c0_seq1/m.56183 type:complete len:431 (-) comp22504_c0_seq1:4069-5361(-)